jgi:hypothetical protein
LLWFREAPAALLAPYSYWRSSAQCRYLLAPSNAMIATVGPVT